MRKAVQAVLDLLPLEADRSEFLRRVLLGYRLNDLGQGSRAIIEGFDLEQEVLAMLERKRPFGQHMHSDYCRFEGKTVNQWLATPEQLPGFLQVMQDKGWIKRNQDPQASRFWQLIDGDGAAMFGVFSPYEKQLLHDWIAGDWTSSEKNPTPRRSRQVATPDAAVPEHDPDAASDLLATRPGRSRANGHADPMAVTGPPCPPGGLLATRRFIELKSSLR
jgi:hypothetical protein